MPSLPTILLILTLTTTQPDYRILVANDDGIDSPGLQHLVTVLATQAEIVVCAPDGNRSGVSQSITVFGKPLTVRTMNLEGAKYACAVSGTPADAVNFGILHLGRERPFDLVISGINRGSNVGNVAHYSGTVGAAMEAAGQGIPAIAVSQDHRAASPDLAAQFTADFVRALRRHGATPGIVYSINVPQVPANRRPALEIAPMSGAYVAIEKYASTETPEDGVEVFRARLRRDEGPPAGDTQAYSTGRITITPLRYDWSDAQSVEILRGWNLAPGGASEPRRP